MTRPTATSTPTPTSTSTGPTTPVPAPTSWRGLRSLHLVRAGFSVAWVALVLATSSSLRSDDGLGVAAAVLLVVYPLWDVVATLLDRRLTASGPSRVRTVNLVLGAAATVALAVAVLTTLSTALLVVGAWASLSGAVQLATAIQRRRVVGAQWPMLVSGGLSVLAGVSIAARSAAADTGLATVAGYSAVGAFWFLVSAVTLTVRHRRAAK